MQFVFAQNDPDELRKTRDQISNAVEKIEGQLYGSDTTALEGVVLFAAIVTLIITSVPKVIRAVFDSGIDGFLWVAILFGGIFVWGMFFVPEMNSESGILGDKLNNIRVKRSKQLIEAVSAFKDLYKQLEVIEEQISISKTVKTYYERFGDDLKISVSSIDKDNYNIKLTGSVRIDNDQVSFTDYKTEEFTMNDDFVSRTFKKDVVDFSWLDNEINTVKTDIQQRFSTRPEFLEEKATEV